MNQKEVYNMFGRVFFLVFITKSINTSTVRISPGPTVDVIVGSPLTLTCTTTYSMHFLNMFDSTLTGTDAAVSAGNFGGKCTQLSVFDNYKFQCDSVSGPYITTIRNVSRKHHNSIFTCQIQYSDAMQDTESNETTIHVNVPLVLNYILPSGIITRNVSDTVIFKCSVTGFPTAQITWQVDGSLPTTASPPITSESGENVISTLHYVVQKAHNGKQLTCTASNGHDPVSASTSLVVQYVPDVEVTPNFDPYNVIENTTNLYLSCTVKGANPTVLSYRWFKDEANISTDPTYMISKVLRSHSGRYTCVATNLVGTSNKAPERILAVLFGVTLNPITAKRPLKGSNLFINCTGQSNPAITNNDVTWTKQNSIFTQTGQQLQIRNVNRNDSGTYICNVALTLSSSDGNTSDVTGATTVQVDVLYKPVVQVYPSYYPYNVIENTKNLNLTCTVKEANPWVTDFKWYVNGSSISTGGTYVIQEVTISNGGIYTCDATNPVGTSNQSTGIILNVLYGVQVDKIDIQQPVEGSFLSITCSGQSNPTIQNNDVTWTKSNDSTFKQIGQNLTIQNVSRNDSGVYICTVVVTLTSSDGTSSDVKGMTTVQVDVLYRPVVNIYPMYKPYNVVENTTDLQLICTVKEANPAVHTFLWKQNTTEISTNASYTIALVQRKHGGNYTCYADNIAGSSAPSPKLVVNILYGVIVNTIGLQHPVEGSRLTVNCTGESYPPIEENETMWTKTNNNTFKHHGKQLIIQNVNRLDNGSYVCTVNKSLTPSVGHITVVTGTTTAKVNVLYFPFVEIITNKNRELLENSTNLLLKCFVKDANPEVEKYKWYKDGAMIPQEQNENYTVNKVYRSDAGYYTCEGISSIGASNSTNLYINVLYGVTLNISRKKFVVNESEKLRIVCTAIGNPLPKLSWINKYNNSVITEKNNVDANDMTVLNANCIDTGAYTCIGNNSIGDIVFYSIDVNVRCHPRTIDNKDTRTIAVDGIGKVLTISEVFISFPPSDVSWSRNTQGDNHTVIDDQFDISNNKSVLPFGTVSTLYKDGIERTEFGKYVAIAENAYGSYTVIYNVIPKGKPDPPTNVSATCDSYSITVIWMSGFNGGDNQTFRLYFRDYYRNKTTLSSVDKPDEGEGNYITLREESFLPDSLYEIYVESKNNFGGINSSEIVTCLTDKRKEKKSTSSVLIGGIAGTTSALVIVCVAVVFIYIMHRRKHQGEDNEPIKHANHYTDEDEDGLKDNPLYETSQQSASGADGTMNSSKHLKKGTEPMKEEGDIGSIYSKVEKIGRTGKKEKHEKKPKNAKNGKRYKDMEMGTVYENSDTLFKDKDHEEVYANASSGKETDQPVNTKKECKSQKNKDGLIYADLDLAPQPSGKRFVIRGLENRNNYAIIDLSKTAEPLPSDTDEEDVADIHSMTEEK